MPGTHQPLSRDRALRQREALMRAGIVDDVDTALVLEYQQLHPIDLHHSAEAVMEMPRLDKAMECHGCLFTHPQRSPVEGG